jgi:hypothetical protein
MNDSGTITGYYIDANNIFHGFVRAADGTITTFDPPNSTVTGPFGINSAGTISGAYQDLNYTEHGFLRAADGMITVVDVRCRWVRHLCRGHQLDRNRNGRICRCK